jgi:ATP-binding cassette subfamily F protein uup
MILVDVDAVTITRPERDLLRDVSLTISTGERIGVVGINGTGKSTLLRVLAGAETPDAGTVRRGRDATIAVLDQDPVLPSGTVREAAVAGLGEGASTWEIEAILDRLGMTPLLDARTEALSGGEAKRVALARTLVSDADLLVLDEPTNHLDIGAIHWLEERLAGHRGAIVLVSHDRHLLDRVTTRVLELDRGKGHLHTGGYDGYLDGKERREELEAKAEDSRRILARQELAWLRRGAPARTRKSKAHTERALAVINHEVDAPARQGDLALHAEMPRLGDQVIELRKVGHGHGDRWLFRNTDLLLGPGDRLGIVGFNGTGKSTLLDIIARRSAPREGEVVIGPTVQLGYHDQLGVELDPEQRVREVITGGKKEPDWRDSALMRSFWFDDDVQWSPVRLLSGGERRRLQLVLTLSKRPNVLLLDEPTNDLDLDTLRALEGFLDDWPGTLIVVSHDRAFLERTVEDVIALDGNGGRAGRFPGGYAAWEEQQRVRSSVRRGSIAATAQPTGSGAGGGGGGGGGGKPREQSTATRTSSGRSVSTIRHEIKDTEKRIARLDKRRGVLNDELVQAAADHARLRELGAELAAIEAELAEAEDRWLELGEELENR